MRTQNTRRLCTVRLGENVTQLPVRPVVRGSISDSYSANCRAEWLRSGPFRQHPADIGRRSGERRDHLTSGPPEAMAPEWRHWPKENGPEPSLVGDRVAPGQNRSSPGEVRSTTAVVIIVVFALAGYLYVLDQIFYRLIDQMLVRHHLP
jgi:hypothetical protein